MNKTQNVADAAEQMVSGSGAYYRRYLERTIAGLKRRTEELQRQLAELEQGETDDKLQEPGRVRG
jgi:hypothetical protein